MVVGNTVGFHSLEMRTEIAGLTGNELKGGKREKKGRTSTGVCVVGIESLWVKVIGKPVGG